MATIRSVGNRALRREYSTGFSFTWFRTSVNLVMIAVIPAPVGMIVRTSRSRVWGWRVNLAPPRGELSSSHPEEMGWKVLHAWIATAS